MINSFTLTLRTENAAFRDADCDGETDPFHDYAARQQIALILRDAAKHIENGNNNRKLMDSNGNTVGRFDCAE